MELLIILIVGGLFAWLGVEMAKTRNRNTTTWGILCFLFGLFAVIVLALIGKAEE
jgi:hypothetical protein